MGVEQEILATPTKVHHFCTDLSYEKGHSFHRRNHRHTLVSGLSDLSISSEDDKPEPEVFASTTGMNTADPDTVANQVELNDG